MTASSREGTPISEALDKYLAQAYRHDVMGGSGVVKMPEADRKLMLEIQAQIARIDALRLGASLASRDFVSYQNRRALVALLDKVKARQEREEEKNHDLPR